ncbi:hypothetical protein FBU59_002802, partial [Linderina macrospora]
MPLQLLQEIIHHFCLGPRPTYENRYGLKYAYELAAAHPFLAEAIPASVAYTVTVEHIHSGNCDGAGSHSSEWRSNIKEFIRFNLTPYAKKLLVIMGSGCKCRPTLRVLMKLFRFDMYNWSNITAVRFAGPGIYEPGNDKLSFTLDQYAKADLAKFRSYLPKLT